MTKTCLWKRGVGLVLCAGSLFGQTPTVAPAFEVATIRAVPPVTAEQMRAGTAHIGMTVDEARVDIGNATLGSLILLAYRVKQYQISGPDWMNGQTFDVLARMPEGASRDQVPAMLQALLAERFKLTVHRERREYPVFALVVGRNGTKVKQASPDAEPALRPSLNPDGTMHIQQSATMAQFADFLTPCVGRPVLDMTEMRGLFQIAMDVARQSRTDPALGTEYFAAVEQLGLKLEPRKMPIETIVVDHLEKSPTAN